MDVIIVCHTEYGRVKDREVIADKNAIEGVSKGVPNLIKTANKNGAKVTFAVMPEVVKDFPKDVREHEIGLHIHAGWQEFEKNGIKFQVGDKYLRDHCKQSSTSTVLRDYTYEEQLDMIKTGAGPIKEELGVQPKSFVAGRWSLNNDTIKALIASGIKHECSASAHSKPCHHDWSRLPRISMPYHPSEKDYQSKGNLPILIIPVSQMLYAGSVNPEVVPVYGLKWLKACFKEYYKQNLPLFHICLHSPAMTDPHLIAALDNLLGFISEHKDIEFRNANEIREYEEIKSRTDIIPYLTAINLTQIKSYSMCAGSRIFKGIK